MQAVIREILWGPRTLGEAPTRARAQRLDAERHQGLSGRATKLLPLLVVGWLVTSYLLVNLRYPAILEGGLNVYFAQPVTWLCLGLLGLIGLRMLPDTPRAGPRWLGLGALLGLFQVASLMIAGLLFGFGRSPYGHDPGVLAGNLVFAGTAICGVEFARAYLLTVAPRPRPLPFLVLISAGFVVLSVPMARWGSVGDGSSFFQFAGGTLLPRLGESMLASVLALVSGPLPAILYRAALEGAEWIPPILPNLPWGAAAFVGTLAPALGLLAVQEQWRGAKRSGPGSHQASSEASRWVVPSALLVVLLWLNLGLFGIQPTVVSGVSMEPALMAGDIVFTRQMPVEEILVGDIVLVGRGGSPVVHRVVEVRGTAQGRALVTKGDANNVEDAPTSAAAIQGKVVLVVPKLGWVTIGAVRVIQWIRALIPA